MTRRIAGKVANIKGRCWWGGILFTLAVALGCSLAVTHAAKTKRQTNPAPVPGGEERVAGQRIQGAQAGVAQQAPQGTTPETPAHKYFTDVQLINQNGEKMRFYSDLLQGKVVVINSFFGTCQGSCLPMNRNLEKVQEALGDHMGKDVYIVSISVDPTVDTPNTLKEYAKKLHARPGWYFLTGEKQNVDFALNKLGQFVPDKQDHLNIIIIGNERTGLWKKAFGLAQSDELVKVVESVLSDPGAK